ncbi:hypothetical protein K438DRAFT_1838769 [Mycena galopus ATCC 62051]|nr:hypothetical protein K438DRAFT_1838769 [Mycena galopus ATCC 62051]
MSRTVRQRAERYLAPSVRRSASHSGWHHVVELKNTGQPILEKFLQVFSRRRLASMPPFAL